MARKKKEEVTIVELKAAAKDFNSFMEFDEPEGIPFDTMEYEDLLEEVEETAEDLEPTDKITAATANTLGKLGIEFDTIVLAEEPENIPDEEDLEPEESSELPSDEEIKKMRKTKLVQLAEKVGVNVKDMKVADIRTAIIEAINEPEEADETEEEVNKIEENADESMEKIESAIEDVKKFRKIEKVQEIAKENGIRIPPPFLKDLKKLKIYVTGKLEELLDQESVAGVIEEEIGQVEELQVRTKKTNCQCVNLPTEEAKPINIDLIKVLCDSIVESICDSLTKRGVLTANDDGTYSFNK